MVYDSRSKILMQLGTIKSCWILLWVLSAIYPKSDGQPKNTKDYCLLETFEPVCQPDELIVMEHALYGRMKLGRCVNSDTGYLGCYSNVLQITDQLCSGQASCDIFIPNVEMNAALSCMKNVRGVSSYLEAGYLCQKVLAPRRGHCNSPERITAVKTKTTIASITSKLTSCGIHGSPWILDAKPGQRIDLQITDFAWKNRTGPSTSCPVNYGYILDMESDDVISICGGGEKRHKILYTSIGNSVQIMLEKSAVESHNFLIHFTAFGCPDYKPPKHSWIQKENDSLVIGCTESEKTWRVTCIDNNWLGIVGNCTAPPESKKEKKKEVKEELPDEPRVQASSDNVPDISNNHVVIFTLGCLTLVICCSVVLLGIFCTKRYEVKIKKYKSTNAFDMKNTKVTLARMPTNSTATYRPVTLRQGQQTNTLNLPTYTFPFQKEDRGPKVPPRNPSFKGRSLKSDVNTIIEENNTYENITGDDDESVHYYVLENLDDKKKAPEQLYENVTDC